MVSLLFQDTTRYEYWKTKKNFSRLAKTGTETPCAPQADPGMLLETVSTSACVTLMCLPHTHIATKLVLFAFFFFSPFRDRQEQESEFPRISGQSFHLALQIKHLALPRLLFLTHCSSISNFTFRNQPCPCKASHRTAAGPSTPEHEQALGDRVRVSFCISQGCNIEIPKREQRDVTR